MTKQEKNLHKGSFQLACIGCKSPVEFSLQELEEPNLLVECTTCHKKYGFGQETLGRQMKKFAALCRQIQESEEILGNASVAVTVGEKEVKIPFKILLSRLQSTLDLQVGGERLVIAFRHWNEIS